MDASGAALAFTYSIASLGEILRAERTMVKRPAKAHLFFLNVGRPSTEIQTFEYIPLRFRTMRSPLAMSVMEGTRSRFGRRKEVVFMTFLLATSRVAGVFGVLDIIVLSLVPGIDRPLRNRSGQAPTRSCHPSV
jgi:hypothetical protein